MQEPRTVGVYLYIQGLFAFAFGPNRNPGKLGIARFGGHLEEGETLHECALREVKEETSLEAALVPSPVTYQGESWDAPLQAIREESEAVKPFLRIGQNVMFFARSDREPVIASETQGIIRVTEAEMIRLCSDDVTYGEFRGWGGRSQTKFAFNEAYIMEPLAQMRFLANFVLEHPNVIQQVYGSR